MLTAKLAAAGLLLMSCVTAHAMDFADRPGYAISPPLLQPQKSLNFYDRPGTETNVIARRPIDRIKTQQRTQTVASSKSWPMSVEHRRVWQQALRWPSLKTASVNPAGALSSRPPLRRLPIAPRPAATLKIGGSVKHVSRGTEIHALAQLGFAEFCAANDGSCDYVDFARHRASLRPHRSDDPRLGSLMHLGFSSTLLSYRDAIPQDWIIAMPSDACDGSLSKRNFLECVGLPGHVLKRGSDVASPLFARTGLIPRGGGRHKVGKPYRVAGKLYRPREDPDYVETGIASWYGAEFHRRMTANGEWFDMDYLSAAHATMPLPSYARVTNLANGKEMIVRVNDRGPFIDGRIIDLSKRSAELLGFKKQGTARVRVQYIGPAPLDDRGMHLAAMNHELEREAPTERLIAAARSLTRQAGLTTVAPSFTE
jgi:rare lipoprotein A (peptidoglycan hydrolase)